MDDGHGSRLWGPLVVRLIVGVLPIFAVIAVLIQRAKVQKLESRLSYTVQSFNERFEDLELRLAGGAPIWSVDASDFPLEVVQFFRDKYPSSLEEGAHNHVELEGSPTHEELRYCSWQDLSRNYSGLWMSRNDAVRSGIHFAGSENSETYDQSCSFLSSRYLCYDKHRKPLSFNSFVWAPELTLRKEGDAEKCVMRADISPEDVGRAARGKFSILFHGNSLVKEFVESLLCQFESQLAGSSGDISNKRAFFNSGLQLHYVFHDYDSKHIQEMYGGQNINEEFDLYVTNYGAVTLKKSVESLGYQGHIFLMESTPKLAMEPESEELNRKTSALGAPFLSLTEMTRQSLLQNMFDPLVVHHGANPKPGDPHLCLPGIHDDAVRVFLHMVVSLIESQ